VSDLNAVGVPDDVLCANLWRRGVPYLSGDAPHAPDLGDPEVIAGLAASSTSRVRHALVAWLLIDPSISLHVPAAESVLNEANVTRLRLLYTGAVRLQTVYEREIRPMCAFWSQLPDFYATKLGLKVQFEQPEAALLELHVHCGAAWGTHVNWAGTFKHIATTVLKQLHKERAWDSQ
jgi:hypothetical protein